MASTIINSEAFREGILNLLNEHMKAEAMPIIDEAIKECEKILDKAKLDVRVKMRGVLANRLISLIEENMRWDIKGGEHRILIKQADPRNKEER